LFYKFCSKKINYLIDFLLVLVNTGFFDGIGFIGVLLTLLEDTVGAFITVGVFSVFVGVGVALGTSVLGVLTGSTTPLNVKTF
jgi:hypothetical protein